MAYSNNNSSAPVLFKLQEFIAHATAVSCLTVGPSQTICATGGADCKINIWDVASGNNLRTLGSNKSAVESLCFAPSEQCIVSGSSSGSIKVFDLHEGRYRNLGSHKTGVTSVQYHPFSDFVASGSRDTTVKVWDVRNKECVSTYSGHEQEVTCVRFSPEGDWVASAGKDGLVLIFDMVAGKHLQTLRLSPAYVTSFEFHPLERILGAATSARSVRLWDLDTMAPLGATAPDASAVRSLGFCTGSFAGGTETPYVVSATKDHIKLWTWKAAHANGHDHGNGSGNGGGGGGASMELKGMLPLGAEGAAMSSMAIDCASGQVTGGSFISNFASLYQTTAEELIDSHARAQTQIAAAAEARADSKPLERPPFQLYMSPASPAPAVAAAGAGNVGQMNSDYKVSNAAVAIGRGDVRHGGLPSAATASHRAESKSSANSNVLQQQQQQQQQYQRGAKGTAASSGHGHGHGHVSDSRLRNPSYEDLAREGDGGEYRGAGSQSRAPAPRSPTTSSQSTAPVGHSSQGGSSGGTNAFANADVLFVPQASSPLHEADTKPKGASLAAAAGLFSPLSDGKACAPAPRSPTFSPPQSKERDHRIRDRRRDVESPDISNAHGPGGAGGAAGGSRIAAALERREAVQELSTRLPPTRYPVPEKDMEKEKEKDASPLRRVTSASRAAANVPLPFPDRERRLVAAPPVPVPVAVSGNARVRDDGSSAAALLADALRGSRDFTSLLSQRLVAVRTLRKMWARGDLEDVIDYLCTVEESAKHDSLQLVILADFFSSIELRGNGLCLDSCVRLLPLLDAILATSTHSRALHGSGTIAPASEHITQAVVLALLQLIRPFGELIRGTCAAAQRAGAVHAGVNLQQDERLSKCKICHQAIVHVRQRLSNLALQHRSNRALTANMQAFHDIAKAF